MPITPQAHCEMIKEAGANQGGWTLVARVDGHTNDFAGISPTWTNADLINEDEATDLTKTSSMKNYGWGNIISSQLMTCFRGPHHHCATFTHNKEMTLANLFKAQFVVETSEQYTFKSLIRKFGKNLDISQLKTVITRMIFMNYLWPTERKKFAQFSNPEVTHDVRQSVFTYRLGLKSSHQELSPRP